MDGTPELISDSGQTSVRQPEAVRLVIWDLDETFWRGTLSEGGITWVQENADMVVELSRRGIINSVCSKNDMSAVDAVLREHGIRDYFVFASVDWSSKGLRLAALVEAVQLRPETILFIDDNAMNRGEAAHYVPGLQVAAETIVPALLEDARLRGKSDPGMTRLAQYRVLEQRQADQASAGGDTVGFLRESGITVSIDFDLEPQLDRAIELINRTNQLNFTKTRLPEDPTAARAALQDLLALHTVSAGILHVRDRYGDYGYCGLYILRYEGAARTPVLLQFAFSCRILGMGVETWLYQHLKRPKLTVAGDVLTDVIGDQRSIDWIRLKLPGIDSEQDQSQRVLSYVMARGACDMRAISHYFDMVAGRVVKEFAGIRDGKMRLSCSSLNAVHAINGAPPALIRDSRPLGFEAEDFESLIANPPQTGPAVWLLNFTLEQSIPVLRHKQTGALLPAYILDVKVPPRQLLRAEAKQSGLDPDLLAHLRKHFTMVGLLPDEIFVDSLRQILRQATAEVRVFILLANEQRTRRDGALVTMEPMRHRNSVIRDVARDFENVELLAPADFMSAEELAQLERPHHYDRVVYFRMFQHIMERVKQAPEVQPAALAYAPNTA